MRTFLIALIAVTPLLAPAPVRAEEQASSQQSFGMVAGRLGGLGFSYRRFRADGWGYGLGGIALFSSSGLSGNVGLQGYRTLHRAASGRLYALGGASLFGDAYAVGTGLGIEIGGRQGPAVALEVPVTYVSSQGMVMIPSVALLYGF